VKNIATILHECADIHSVIASTNISLGSGLIAATVTTKRGTRKKARWGAQEMHETNTLRRQRNAQNKHSEEH